MARYDIGRHAKTTAVKRSLARRERDVEVSEAFLLKIERGVLRRAKRTDALFKRAGMEEYHVPRVVEDSVRRLSVEIRQLPQSGRRLTRLRRDEVETVLALIRKLVRRQARLEVLLANESVWRRQLKQKLATTDAILPLLHAGNLDQLEELLAQRRGKAGANRAAQTLGRLRAQKHPYGKEHFSALSHKRWARVREERAHGDKGRTTGTTGGAGDADGESLQR
jgi:hypothetical protein